VTPPRVHTFHRVPAEVRLAFHRDQPRYRAWTGCEALVRAELIAHLRSMLLLDFTVDRCQGNGKR
jgi:hypothetical protein